MKYLEQGLDPLAMLIVIIFNNTSHVYWKGKIEYIVK